MSTFQKHATSQILASNTPWDSTKYLYDVCMVDYYKDFFKLSYIIIKYLPTDTRSLCILIQVGRYKIYTKCYASSLLEDG